MTGPNKSFDATHVVDPPQVALGYSPTIPEMWRRAVANSAQVELVRRNGVGFTFQDIEQASAAMAQGLLASGAGKGTRIGVLAPNGPEWITAWLAGSRIGAIVVGLSTFSAPKELEYAIRHADIAILLVVDAYLSHDYCAYLETAAPELAHADGERRLSIRRFPYLRSVWVAGSAPPSWAAGSFDDLAELGRTNGQFDAAHLREVESCVSPADRCIIIYTSGSTAAPKGVVHTQGTVVRKSHFAATSRNIIPAYLERGDRIFATQPFFWVGGMLALLGCIHLGATVVCEDDHSQPHILATLVKERITHLPGTAGALKALSQHPQFTPEAFAHLKQFTSMQAPFFNKDASLTADRFSHSIGMTETFGPHSGRPDGSPLPAERAGSFGNALDCMEYKIVDPGTEEVLPANVSGDLAVRGGWLMDGMYKRERHEIFMPDGFYRTGDQCRLDEAQFLYFEGRLSGMIKTSGANVAPDEVRNVLLAVDGISEAEVVGVPDPKLGQMVVALIVRNGKTAVDLDALRRRLRESLSSFKVPKRFVFAEADEIARSANGKVQRQKLLELVEQKLAVAASDGASEAREIR